MFQKACTQIRESLYGIVGRTQTKKGKGIRQDTCNSSGFSISTGIIATTAHSTHIDNNRKKANHKEFHLIRAPDIGQSFETAQLIFEDVIRDIALLKIEKPRSVKTVILQKAVAHRGTSCGTLGFPLAEVTFSGTGFNYSAMERFQGGYISNYLIITKPKNQYWYEVDYLMYGGSSGCPGFVNNGNVIGMQSGTLNPPKVKKTSAGSRLAIARWVPSMDIITFCNKHKIKIQIA